MKKAIYYFLIIYILSIYGCEDTDLVAEKEKAAQMERQEAPQITPANHDKRDGETRDEQRERKKSNNKGKRKNPV